MKIVVAFLLVFLLIGCTSSRIQLQRIIGGFHATIRSYPYITCLLIKSELFAEPELFAGAAVIISPYWAITAAHCVEEFMDNFLPSGHLFIRSNTTIWNTTDGTQIDHLVLKAYVNEQYSNITNDYDIALLKVKEKFTGRYEKPIPIAGRYYEHKTGSAATVIGWGTTMTGSDPFTVPNLRAVEINLIDHDVCENKYKNDNEDLTPRMMCAGAPGRDACVDDSGGPLVQNRILIGIVSWGIECANEEHPGVYTNLTNLADWLEDKFNTIKSEENGLDETFIIKNDNRTPGVYKRKKTFATDKNKL